MTEQLAQFVNASESNERSVELITLLYHNSNAIIELSRICKLSPSYDMFYIKGLDDINKTDKELFEEIKQLEMLNDSLLVEMQKMNRL